MVLVPERRQQDTRMTDLTCFDDMSGETRTITPLAESAAADWLPGQPPATAALARAAGFAGKLGEIAHVPDGGDGTRVLVGLGDGRDWQVWGGVAERLPKTSYRIDGTLDDPSFAALGWALGAYRFDRYQKTRHEPARLVPPEGADRRRVEALARAAYLVRDLVNTPAGDLGPTQLAEAAADLARRHGAAIETIVGEDLLARNYPMIHAVGRAAADAPRLIDLRWGDEAAPKVTLIGKGVCFDTGGLDLKPASGMLLMKKDMGGAAHVLGIAQAIMELGLELRLRVLIPAVENAVSGNAFRPLDVLRSRKGTTVEIGNTDAEGRLVLADAITEAVTEQPDYLIDFATLTGAARVALGTDLPALFVNAEDMATDLLQAADRARDPVWRLPLWPGYRAQLRSSVADLSNTGEGHFGGAITAALFLEHFVPEGQKWAHLDIMAWNTANRPSRPKGGEALGLRAVVEMLSARYGG